MVLAASVFLSSCDEELLPEDEESTNVLESFAGEGNALQSIGDENLSILEGDLPYLSTGRDSIVPEGAMLFVPQRAYEDDVVEHSEILALLSVPGNQWGTASERKCTR